MNTYLIRAKRNNVMLDDFYIVEKKSKAHVRRWVISSLLDISDNMEYIIDNISGYKGVRT